MPRRAARQASRTWRHPSRRAARREQLYGAHLLPPAFAASSSPQRTDPCLGALHLFLSTSAARLRCVPSSCVSQQGALLTPLAAARRFTRTLQRRSRTQPAPSRLGTRRGTTARRRGRGGRGREGGRARERRRARAGGATSGSERGVAASGSVGGAPRPMRAERVRQRSTSYCTRARQLRAARGVRPTTQPVCRGRQKQAAASHAHKGSCTRSRAALVSALCTAARRRRCPFLLARIAPGRSCTPRAPR